MVDLLPKDGNCRWHDNISPVTIFHKTHSFFFAGGLCPGWSEPRSVSPLKIWSSGWSHLGNACVELRRGYVGKFLPYMVLVGGLAMLQGVETSLVGRFLSRTSVAYSRCSRTIEPYGVVHWEGEFSVRRDLKDVLTWTFCRKWRLIVRKAPQRKTLKLLGVYWKISFNWPSPVGRRLEEKSTWLKSSEQHFHAVWKTESTTNGAVGRLFIYITEKILGP